MASRAARWLVRAALRPVAGSAGCRGSHRTPFVRRAARLGLTRPRPQAPGPRVAYFVDVFANYFDQELAEAVVAVLHQAGSQRLRPHRPARLGHAGPGRGRHRPRPRPGPGEPPRPGQRRPRRLHRRLLRADRRPDAPPGIPQADRRPRRRARGREHAWTSASISPASTPGASCPGPSTRSAPGSAITSPATSGRSTSARRGST